MFSCYYLIFDSFTIIGFNKTSTVVNVFVNVFHYYVSKYYIKDNKILK